MSETREKTAVESDLTGIVIAAWLLLLVAIGGVVTVGVDLSTIAGNAKDHTEATTRIGDAIVAISGEQQRLRAAERAAKRAKVEHDELIKRLRVEIAAELRTETETP